MSTPRFIVDKILSGEWTRAEAIVAVVKYANLHPAREIEDAFRPFVEACKRFEANRHVETGGGFDQAFRAISIADVRRAAAIELGPEDRPSPAPKDGGAEA